VLHVKLIEPPCTERYARWCERSKIPHQEEFSPTRLAEGILSGILAEIRTNAGNELADDTARYEEELKEYYEAQIKEKEEAFKKEKAELIRTFEEPAVLEETEEPEMAGAEEAPSEAPVIIETKEIVEETEVD